MLDKIIIKFEDYVTIFCFTMMSVITLLAVIYRYIFSSPLIWSEELARYLMVWGVFIGISIVTRKNAQLALDLLDSFAPEKIKTFMRGFFRIFLIISFLTLFLLSVQFVYYMFNIGHVTPVLRIDFWIIYTVIPLGFLLSAYHSIKIFIKHRTKEINSSDIESGV
ncbi:TRAP transporter small permease [Salinicoccus sp. Marseille-QA3877]